MTRRAITILSLLAALGATSVGVGTAAAKHGADDPAGHVRHTGTDDGAKAKAARKHHVRHHRGRGRDDGPNHR